VQEPSSRRRPPLSAVHERLMILHNLLRELPDASTGEVFNILLQRPGIRLEQIVSQGQITPEDEPYDQPHDEWVLLLAGAAHLWVEGEGEQALAPGDMLLIPANVRHRVTWTQAEPPTVWLALHLEG
jgi:cupin 2 domain-containing protein